MDLIAQAVICGLAGWRMASLLVQEDGPADLLLKFRTWALREGADYSPTQQAWTTSYDPQPGFAVLLCIWCMSVWTTAAAWAVYEWQAWPVAMVAAMGVAIIANRASTS